MIYPVDWFDRFNPFTESYSPESISNEKHTIPSSSPYWIRLLEVPRDDTPSTVSVRTIVELAEDLDISETGVDIAAGDYAKVAVDDILKVDDEQMSVDAKPGSPTLTVTRGYGGTTPATHSNGTEMQILSSFSEITSGSPATDEFRVDYKYNSGLLLFHSDKAGYDVWVDYYGLGTPFNANNLVTPQMMAKGSLVVWTCSGGTDITATSWAQVDPHSAYVWMPKGPVKLHMSNLLRADTGGGETIDARMKVSGNSGSNNSTGATSTTWKADATLDVSSETEGLVEILVQAQVSGGTGKLQSTLIWWDPVSDEG